MRLVMYIFLNQELGMSTGKAAAQASHAAVRAFLDSDTKLVEDWFATGETKVTLTARDTDHILMIERYLKDRNFDPKLIIDEGRTEIASLSPTALGIPIVDKDLPEVQFAFEDFKTYRDKKPIESPKKLFRRK